MAPQPKLDQPNLTIGGTRVDLGPTQLGKFAKQAFEMAVTGSLAGVLEKPVSSLPSGENGFQGGLSFTPGTSWELGEVGMSLAITTSAAADVAIVTGGALFSYTNGLANPQQVSVSVPGGSAFIKIQFDVSATGNLATNANLGTAVGISGSAQAGVNFRLAYFKQVVPATSIKEALIDAVKSFTLPFHSATLTELGKGDYLYHSFAGNLALGFGVHYGVKGALLSGRSVQEVKAAFESKIVSESLSLSPTFQAGAGLDLTYKHNDLFEILLHREAAGAGDTAQVHLFRADKSNLGLTLTAAINVDHGANFQITTNLGTVIDQIAGHVTANLPDTGAKATVSGAVTKLFSAGSNAVQSFVGDVNKRVNGMLQTVSNRGVELQAAIEAQKSRASLFSFTFDLTNGNVDKAWQAAMKGDFVTAFLTPGRPVDVDPGSGVEEEFIRRSSVSLNLFGLFQVTSATQFFSNSSVAYAGNGVFNLIFNTGTEWDTATHSTASSAAITFSAAATSHAMENIQGLSVNMSVALSDTERPEAALLSARVLADCNLPDLQEVAARAESFARSQSKGKLVVQAELLPSAYGRMRASAFTGKKPPALPQADDANNFSNFVAACRDLFADDAFDGFPDLCRDYAQWQEYNQFVTGEAIANRRGFGPRTAVPPFWPGSLTDNERSLIVVRIEAAQRFMNLCDDLQQLAATLPDVQTAERFQKVVDTLKFMVKNDASVWFTKPALLALLLLMPGTSATGVQTSQGMVGNRPQFTVSFQIQ